MATLGVSWCPDSGHPTIWGVQGVSKGYPVMLGVGHPTINQIISKLELVCMRTLSFLSHKHLQNRICTVINFDNFLPRPPRPVPFDFTCTLYLPLWTPHFHKQIAAPVYDNYIPSTIVFRNNSTIITKQI